MLKKIRITLAVVFFVLITALLLDFTGTLHVWLGWMSKVQLLTAVFSLNVVVIVALVLLTLIFGRIYCSVICPLGVMQDIFFALHIHKKKNSTTYSKAKDWLRYPIFAIFVVAVLLGVGSVVTLLSPYGTYGAIANNLLEPIYLWINNGLADIAEHFGSYALYPKDVWIKSLPVFIVSLVLFVIIALLAARGGRTYCNTICPVGTILGFLARFSWLKVYFKADNCKSCSLCTKNCKSSCIDYKNHKVDYSRCVLCGDCLTKCNFGALTYGHPKKQKKQDQPSDDKTQKVDTTRRAVLVGAAIVGADVALAQTKKKVDGGLAVLEDKVIPEHTPITPPGSISAANMQQRCVGCQLCVTNCPNGVLRPSSDPMHFMQPVLVYDKSFCRPECTKCSEVCPSGAIKPITVEQKSAIQIGHAQYIRKNCVVITDEVDCGNCARHCPTGAIQMVPSDPNDDTSFYIPAINVERCIGCGSCQYVCPARPGAAIYVDGHELHKQI